MVGMAENGGGNYYFIENPTMLASIMCREFDLLSSLVARNVAIELTLGRDVRLRDVIGCEYASHSDHYVVSVGDLYANETREFSVELSIPPGEGLFTAARGILRYDSVLPGPIVRPAFVASVHYTNDVALIDKDRNLEAQAKADVALSTRSVQQAMEALDSGKPAEAARVLQDAKSTLSASPAASVSGAGGAAVRNQATRLDSFEQLLKESSDDTRRAKKSIQYENYKTQKNKD
jgi:Ca-activated chloride channel family protein